MDWFLPAVAWYLATTAAALAVAPLVALLFHHVTNRGAGLHRPLGLLLVVWPVWLLAGIGDGLAPFSGPALWLSVMLVGGGCWLLASRTGVIDGVALRHFAVVEVVYLALFGILLVLRGFIPAVGGPGIIDQEKPMDLMMLAASMRAEAMPPGDAWLAGESINYYYLGYALWGAMGSMAGVTPAEGYNLAVVSTIAMTLVVTFGTVAAMLDRFTTVASARVGGALAALFLAAVGTPWAAREITGDLAGEWGRFPFDGMMWNATRIIPVSDTTDAISEFPAFTFLFADLHPHMMAIPFAVTVLGLAWMLASLPPHRPTPLRVLQLVVTGIAAVALYALNSWDFPTWFAVVAGSIVISTGFRRVSSRIAAIGLALASGVLAWLPFILAFEAPVRTPDTGFADAVQGIPMIGEVLASIAAYHGDRTDIGDWLGIFGFFYPVLVVAIAVALLRQRSEDADGMVTTVTMITAALVVATGLLADAPLLILLGLPLLGGLLFALRATDLSLELVIVALGSLSLLLALIPEGFYLYDIFGSRMNTIFKLYLQSWLLAAVASAMALVWLWQRARGWATLRTGLAVATATILLGGLAYPVVGASQWIEFKNPNRDWEGIDGLAWLETSSAADPATRDALAWLWEHGDRDDVLLAAGGCAYRSPIGFPAAATGIPVIVGWDNHQRQWRLGDPEIDAELQGRVADVVALFDRPTDELLDRYGVTLLYIGRPETEGVAGLEFGPTCAPGPFPEATSPEFPGAGWDEVFSEDGVRILRRATEAP